MSDAQHVFNRRQLLTFLFYGSAAGLLGRPRRAWALGRVFYRQGIRKLGGAVSVNGRPAAIDDLVHLGDTVTTGADGFVVFVIDRGVYLLRENTEFVLTQETVESGKTRLEDVIRIARGKMLAVMARTRRKQLRTPTAVMGIRGSGAYVEAMPDRTYFCLCYGSAEITASAEVGVSEHIRTTHHESPRYIQRQGGHWTITPAPVMHHTDAELIMLEAMVWRQPPFVGNTTKSY